MSSNKSSNDTGGNAGSTQQQNSAAAQSSSARSTGDAEKAWVKENYGNEFKFLASHGMSIYKEDDREEGRAIVRGFMEYDRQSGR